MKQGLKPTRRQKQLIKSCGLDPDSWLVSKNLPDKLYIVHRISEKVRVIEIKQLTVKECR